MLMLKQNLEENDISKKEPELRLETDLKKENDYVKENELSNNFLSFMEENGANFPKQEPIESTLESLANKQ